MSTETAGTQSVAHWPDNALAAARVAASVAPIDGCCVGAPMSARPAVRNPRPVASPARPHDDGPPTQKTPAEPAAAPPQTAQEAPPAAGLVLPSLPIIPLSLLLGFFFFPS